MFLAIRVLILALTAYVGAKSGPHFSGNSMGIGLLLFPPIMIFFIHKYILGCKDKNIGLETSFLEIISGPFWPMSAHPIEYWALVAMIAVTFGASTFVVDVYHGYSISILTIALFVFTLFVAYDLRVFSKRSGRTK